MKPLALAIVFVAALVAGWFTGGRSHETPAAQAPPVPPASSRPTRVSAVPEGIRDGVRTIRRAGSRTERMRRVVLLATRIPVEEFPHWYSGNFLEFLDGQLEGLFYQILTDRWMESDAAGAARWMVEHRMSSGTTALAGWVRQDQAAALAFYHSLPGDRRSKLARAVIGAVGEHDVPAALAMLDDLRGTYVSPSLIVGLASRDREAVCAHANQADGEARRSLLRNAAAAWLEKDFAWVVAMMQREGLGPKTFGDITNYGGSANGGLAVLKNAALLPEGWLEQVSRSNTGTLTLQCELEWLNVRKPRPGISEEVLRRIQIQAAQTPWWYNDKRAAGIDLVANGEWLPEEARQKTARTLALRWRDDPEAARQWIDTLAGDTRTAAEEGYAEMSQQLETTHGACNTPEKITSAIAQGSFQWVSQWNIQWSEDQIAAATRVAGALDPGKAVGMLDVATRTSDRLPDPISAAILARALAAEPAAENSGGLTQKDLTRGACALAARWAAREPAKAGAWASNLPPGEARLWTIKNVATQWCRFSPTEVRNWAESLTKSERQAVLAIANQSP